MDYKKLREEPLKAAVRKENFQLKFLLALVLPDAPRSSGIFR